jgi:anti-anti-sigma regulatory factor
VASNFQIFTFKTNESLHLKLYGDFDVDSAQELANTLIEHCGGPRDIFIDTKNLEAVHPFGKVALQMNLRKFKRQLNNFFFTGANKHKII